jgi:hypothetical protein
MKAPVSRRRGKRPALAIRNMDLLGVGKDGNLYVWETAADVQPLDRLPKDADGHIISGHYVIERYGKAVTAHLGNSAKAGWVVVQYMCGGVRDAVMPRSHAEDMLLGRKVPDPVKEAEILHMLQKMNEDLTARQTAPHRKRGKA